MPRRVARTISLCLPERLLARWHEMERFYNHGNCPIRIGEVETTSRSELLHQVVSVYCLGGWGPPVEAEESGDGPDVALHIKLREQEAGKWLVWIRDGHARTHSELARRAMDLYLQWWEHRRWQDWKRFQRILELGQKGDISALRTVTL